MKEFKFHPLANCLPLMEGEEFSNLVEDISKNGLIDPITLHEGAILDGRNRYRACKEAGFEPDEDMFVEYKGDDPTSFVITKNIHRRHLKPGQIAAILAEIETVGRTGGDRKSEKSKVSNDTSDKSTMDKLAKDAGIGRATLARARKTKRENPEAHQAALKGKKIKSQPKQPSPSIKEESEARKRTSEIYDWIKTSGENPTSKILREQAGVDRSVADIVIAIKKKEEEILTNLSPANLDLSITSQQKLEAAIIAHKKKLELEFDYRVQQGVRDWANEYSIPKYTKKIDELIKLLSWPHTKFMSKTEYNQILRCLHPDNAMNRTTEQLEEAFRTFTHYKLKMVNDASEQKRVLNNFPRNAEEMEAWKKKTTEERKKTK